MKKEFLSWVLILTSLTAFSQVKMGVRAGLNQAKLTKSSESKTDFYAGVLLNVHLSDFYELQPEITYSRQGGGYYDFYNNTSGVNGNAFDESIVDLNYVSIGLTNKFFIMNDSKLHVLVGPSIDFIFENNFINLANGEGEIEFTPIDFTLYLGVGYQFDFGLSIEARYKRGLLDVNFDEYYNSNTGKYEDEVQLNSVFQIGASYKFDFSKK